MLNRVGLYLGSILLLVSANLFADTPATVAVFSNQASESLLAKDTTAPLKLLTHGDSVQYALGVTIGTSLLTRGFVSIDLDYFLAGLNDLYHKNKLLISDSSIVSIVNQFQLESQAKQGKSQEAQLFTQLKDKPDIGRLPSGVQYQVIKEGTGARPQVTDTIVCNLQGLLLNGTEFQNTFSTNQPAVLTPGKMVRGLQEAVQLMQAGSVWRVFIPSSLAYGEKGSGAIPPNNALVIVVELKEVRKHP